MKGLLHSASCNTFITFITIGILWGSSIGDVHGFVPHISSSKVVLPSTRTSAFVVNEKLSSIPRALSLPKILASNTRATRLFSAVAAIDNDKYTVQILMSDTGGGHRASANALRDAFDTLYPNQFECDIVDIYTEYGPFWPYDDYVRCYKIMAEYSFLWEAFYNFGTTPFGLWLNELLLETFCFDSFKDCMTRNTQFTDQTKGKRADMVISVHPLCQDLPLKILNYIDSEGESREGGRTTPFATVVTDLGGAHPTWFNPGVDKCFVPSDVLYQCACDRELTSNQLVLHGLPIRRGFWADDSLSASSMTDDAKYENDDMNNKIKTSQREALRSKLGLDLSSPAVLVVGGGDGMGGIVETAKCLGAKLAGGDDNDYQMVVVCGNNKVAQEELSKMNWSSGEVGDGIDIAGGRRKGINVVVNGFVDNMDEWMRSCDVIVTKAGPGTIAEASICGLPCMLSSFLPGQETGNIPYVENAAFGKYSGDPKIISETVFNWLQNPEMLSNMKDAALKVSRPTATLDIARDLAEMAFTAKKHNQK